LCERKGKRREEWRSGSILLDNSKYDWFFALVSLIKPFHYLALSATTQQRLPLPSSPP
jgi:hypothetical protein